MRALNTFSIALGILVALLLVVAPLANQGF